MLDTFTAETVASLTRMLEDANAADGHHAAQGPGHLYGNVWRTRRDLLIHALADTTVADEVAQHLIDQYRPTAATVHEVVAYVLDKQPCHAARTGNGYWTCDHPGGCTDCRALAAEADDDRFGA